MRNKLFSNEIVYQMYDMNKRQSFIKKFFISELNIFYYFHFIMNNI